MATTARLTGRMRRRLGNPTQNEVPDRELIEFLSSSVGFLASYLKFTVVTDLFIEVVANQMEYEIPKSALYFQWVQLGGHPLQPSSTWAMNSGAVTTASSGPAGGWLNATPGLPTAYAVEGREMILNPPPSAATAAQFPTMEWRFIASGTEWAEQAEIGIGTQGMPFVSDVDEDLIIYDAAIAYCAAHPSQENQQRVDNFQAEIARRLPEAKRRWESSMIRDYLPTARPDTSGRMYAAR